MTDNALSILVVDDDSVFRSRLARAFRDRGLTTFEACSTSEAMTLVKASQPTHGVIDLRIGDQSGIELVRELRDILPSIQLVILTGYGSIATAVEAVQLGAVNYLTKPCDADRILKAFMGKISETPPSVPSLSEVEWEHIQRVLTDTGGNVSKAAKTLRLHRRSLQRKLSRPRPV